VNQRLLNETAYGMAKEIVEATGNPSRMLDEEEWLYVVWKWCRSRLEDYEADVDRMEKLLRPSRN
jgi:hypothetical protein